jgi:hypothetical protein
VLDHQLGNSADDESNPQNEEWFAPLFISFLPTFSIEFEVNYVHKEASKDPPLACVLVAMWQYADEES